MSDLDRLAEPDRAWADAVVAACAPVFDAAGVGFVWQCVTEPDGRLAARILGETTEATLTGLVRDIAEGR